MARKLPQPISKEDFDKLLDASKRQLEPYWMPRKEEYHPRGKTLQQYIIAMILGFGSGMRISEIVGLNKTYKYKYPKKDGTLEEKTQVCLIQAIKFKCLLDIQEWIQQESMLMQILNKPWRI